MQIPHVCKLNADIMSNFQIISQSTNYNITKY